MPEISLNILDVAQNSVTAGASLTEIGVVIDNAADRLEVTVRDNGRGMLPEQVENVVDPFYTTRSTRKVGLGVPFLKMAAEMTGGRFSIESKPDQGTMVKAVFGLTHIDRMPLGDLAATMVTMIASNPDIDFVMDYSVDGRNFTVDTREIREILDGVPLSEPEILNYITEHVNANVDDLGTRY